MQQLQIARRARVVLLHCIAVSICTSFALIATKYRTDSACLVLFYIASARSYQGTLTYQEELSYPIFANAAGTERHSRCVPDTFTELRNPKLEEEQVYAVLHCAANECE